MEINKEFQEEEMEINKEAQEEEMEINKEVPETEDLFELSFITKHKIVEVKISIDMF